MTERPETIEAVLNAIWQTGSGNQPMTQLGRLACHTLAAAAIAALRAADASAGLVTVPRERADKAALVVKEARILISQVPLDPLTISTPPRRKRNDRPH